MSGQQGNNGASIATQTAEFDRYLARCVQAYLHSEAMPSWPIEPMIEEDAAIARVYFHGVALLLVNHQSGLSDWPEQISEQVREEARLQSFWEMSHRQTMALLVDAFAAAGIDTKITKGTALAYSHYPDPALRRRGDTDIVIEGHPREKAREILRSCGFSPCDDMRTLQETWQKSVKPNFTHPVDVHWRINASAVISERLERSTFEEVSIALTGLSPNARGASGIENLILVCMNRALHASHGYQIADAKLFESDRLIWAVDIDLIARAFSPPEWDKLVNCAAASGTASIVVSGLRFAQQNVGTSIPERVLSALANEPDDARIGAILTPASPLHRNLMELAATKTLSGKARMLRHLIFPTQGPLRERYPNADNWPTALLRVRRLFGGVGTLFRSAS